MPKLLKATDPITPKSLIVLLYGQPGTGKTTLALTAETPLLIDADRGAHRAGIRGNSIPVESWQDFVDLLDSSKLDDELNQVLSISKTIIIDTIGKLQDFQSDAIIKSDFKMANKAGSLTLQGYGAMNSGFKQFLSRLRLMNKDIIIIAHEKEDKDGDNIILRPDIMGGSYGNVMKELDLAGRFYIENGKRVINFNPTDRSVGKNCAELPIMTDPKMSDILTLTKNHIIQVNENQAALLTSIAEMRTKLDQTKDDVELNTIVAEIMLIENDIVKMQLKPYISQRVKELDLAYDKEHKLFIRKEVTPE